MVPRFHQDLPFFPKGLPLVVENFPQGAGLAVDDRFGHPAVDGLGFVEIALVLGGLEAEKHGLEPVHIGVLPKDLVFARRLPVAPFGRGPQPGLNHGQGRFDQAQRFLVPAQAVIGDEPQHEEGGVVKVDPGVEDGALAGEFADPDAVPAPAVLLHVSVAMFGDHLRVRVPAQKRGGRKAEKLPALDADPLEAHAGGASVLVKLLDETAMLPVHAPRGP